jgi:hypothetical protein
MYDMPDSYDDTPLRAARRGNARVSRLEQARKARRDVALGLSALALGVFACVKIGSTIGASVADKVGATRLRNLDGGVDSAAGFRRTTGEKVELDLERYPKARCLDGTPGAYYVNLAQPSAPGEDAQKENEMSGYATARTWVVMLQGGGECVNPAECAERAGTPRGSSELVPEEIVFDSGIQKLPIDGEDRKRLPFAAANMVNVAYCSGDVYLGRAQDKDANALWHDGAYIVQAVLQELIRAYGMADADVIVLAGRSAGGIGLIAQVDSWADFIRSKLPPMKQSLVKIVGAPFAGFHYFHDDQQTYEPEDDQARYVPWNEDSFKRYLTYWHGENSLPQACVDEHKDAPWQCVVANASFPYTRTPLFFSQALTDSVVMHLHDNFDGGAFVHKEQVEFAQNWGGYMRNVLKPVLEHPTSGLFAAACYIHTDFDDIVIDDVEHHIALADWVFKNKRVKLMDSCDEVMCNPTCKVRGEKKQSNKFTELDLEEEVHAHRRTSDDDDPGASLGVRTGAKSPAAAAAGVRRADRAATRARLAALHKTHKPKTP